MTLQEESILSCYQELCAMPTGEDIFLVRHTATGRLYIKKVLRFYDKKLYLRLMELRPAGIPRIYECIEDADRLILIEEYIHGDTLEVLANERPAPFPEEAVIDCALQLCEILIGLHRLDPPIIHRDIKPANVMLSADGRIKLIDFNVARAVNPDSNRDTVFMGTQDYAAPEQYGFGQSDVRTDIYSLGATMNQLLTRKTPTEGIAAGRLGSIIRTCTRMDPGDRYPSVEALQADLLRLTNDPPAGEPARPRNSWALPGFRTRTPLHMLVAIVGYLFVIAISLSTPDPPPATAADAVFNAGGNLLIFFATILWFCNYRGVWNRLPGMHGSPIRRAACCLIYWGILILLIASGWAVLFNLI